MILSEGSQPGRLREDFLDPQHPMTFKNSQNLDIVRIKSVYDPVSLKYEFSYDLVGNFWYNPPQLRLVD